MKPELLNGAAYLRRHVDDVEPVDCPCGRSTRIITSADTPAANLHVTEIAEDARLHYHTECMEMYHVLEGCGKLEVGNDVLELRPGDTVVIPPGTRHRAEGRPGPDGLLKQPLKVLIVGVPAFDPEDEYFD